MASPELIFVYSIFVVSLFFPGHRFHFSVGLFSIGFFPLIFTSKRKELVYLYFSLRYVDVLGFLFLSAWVYGCLSRCHYPK